MEQQRKRIVQGGEGRGGNGNGYRAVRLVAAGTGGSGSVNIRRQLLFVSLTQAAVRRVRMPHPAADADKTCGRDIKPAANKVIYYFTLTMF